MIRFQNIEYLLTLLAIPVLVFLFAILIKWKKNTAKKIGDPELVKALTVEYSAKKFLTKFILSISAFALCAFAITGLVRPDSNHKVQRKGIDMVIALDVSKSMLANDIKPNRLERAKQVISRLIDNSPNDRIGLVIFAGRAYLQMPLTLDHAAAKMYLSSAKPEDIPTQGTILSNALKMSMEAFNPEEKTFKSVLLISDGEDHEPDAIKEAKTLFKNGIIINTIGIGSPMGAPIIDEETGEYKLNSQGQTVITKLNEDMLRNIAGAGHGIYQLYTNSEDITQNLKNKFSTMEKDSIVSEASYSSYVQYFQYFLAGAILLLITEYFMAEKKKKKILKPALLLSFFFLAGNSIGQSVDKNIVRGNRAFIENKFDEAENDYRSALKKNSTDGIAGYNLGNVLFRRDKEEEAAKAYDGVIEHTKDNSLKQKAFYNKGVAMQKAKKLPESILAYKNALILNPNDEDARQNLQRALHEQQQQDKKDNPDKKDKQDKNQDDKKDQPDKKNQQKPKEEEAKPQPSRLTKQQAEEKLKSLAEKEKDLQNKLNKVKGAAPNAPEKDW